MLRSKRLISMGLTALMVSAYSSGAYTGSVNALEMTKQAKMSEVLLAEMDKASKNEKVPVAIELEDINQNEVEKAVDKQTGMTLAELEAIDKKLLKSDELKNASNEELETLLPKYFKDTESDREYVQSLVNERIMAERKIAKEMYDKQNSDYVEKTGIDETEVQFVSSYSPMVITECTEDEIDDIVVQGKVKSIDIHEELEIVKNSTVSKASTTSSSNVTTAWRSAINANGTRSMGIKGNGVTVGVFDVDTVYKDHEQLKDTDITVLDKAVHYKTYHGTKVTRIIAGKYGIASKAKVYTAHTDTSITTYYEDIENLISKGVSVINMSLGFGDHSDDYYTQLEKWIDHVSYQHNVTIVFVSGNAENGNYTTGVGGLSYNCIGVGGIDTKNTDAITDDTLHYNSGYNDTTHGCAKPECMAAYNDVLEENMNGTSFAAPAVTGVCAQIIQVDPTLTFHPQLIKAIIMASCDRKGSEDYASGLTAKEGSGVVNSWKAVVIASLGRYKMISVNGVSNSTTNIDFTKRKDASTTKLVMAWMVPSKISYTSHSSPSYAVSPGNCDFDLAVYSSENVLLGKSKLANSSAEAVVFNLDDDTLQINCNNYTSLSSASYEIALAWF